MSKAILIACLFVSTIAHGQDSETLRKEIERARKIDAIEDRITRDAKAAREKQERDEQYQMGQALVIAIGFGVLVWLWRRDKTS